MDGIALMEGFGKRLKAAEKELQRLEKLGKKLAEQDKDIRAKRQSLEGQITEHEDSIAALEAEDSEAKNELLEAMLNDDVARERCLKQRRKQIAEDIRGQQQEVERLRDCVDELDDTKQDAAELAAKLDSLSFGSAWQFATQLRNVLVGNELRLKSRLSEAKRILPKYDQRVYREVVDELYSERSHSSVEDFNYAKRQREKEAKDAAATKQFVGVGSFGGSRRTEPDERDFSS